MLKRYLLPFAAVCALLFSCKVEEPAELQPGNTTPGYVLVDLSAELEAVKSDISEGHTVWSAGDAIKIYWDGGCGTASLVSGAGSSSATFRGQVPEGKAVKYAVYPADAESSLDESTVSVQIPINQTGSFKAGNIAVSNVDGSGVLHFFNVNSFICVELKGSDITEIEVESVDGSPLVGVQDVSFASGAAIGGASATSSFVSITASGAGKYFISILPGVTHKSGLLLKYYKTSGVSKYHLAKSISTVRSHVLAFGEFEPDGNYYVTVAGAGNHSGVSWENAFSKDQMWEKLYLSGEESAEEKDAKIAAIDGATFHLGAGTYDFGENPNIKYEGSNTVVLNFKGGYPAGGGTQNLSSYRADFTGSDAHAALRVKGKVDVSFEGIGFVHGSVSEDEKGVIDLNGDPNEGWEITASMSHCYIGGNTNTSFADASHENHNQGAGLRLRWVSYFSADHVTFENNTSYAAAGAFIRNTQAEFTDCVFRNNTVYNKAGAVYVTGDDNDSSVTVFTSCTFDGNVSEAYNGGAILQNKGRGKYTNCTFTNNKALNKARVTEDGYGGAISHVGGPIDIKNCSFSGNVAYQGGCIAFSSSGEATVEGSSFDGNGDASLSGDGGALSVSKGTVTISNCTFTGNTAFNDTADRDDGEGYGGAIDSYAEAKLIIEDCTFSGNTAWTGGAVNANCAGGITVSGSTFTGNGSANTRNGGALFVKKKTNVTESSFYSNTSKYGGAILLDGGATLKPENSDFYGNTADDGGAIYVKSNSHLYIKGGRFGGTNDGEPNYATNGNGGAIYLKDKSWFTVTEAQFSGNRASSFAGSIYAGNTGNCIIEGCDFTLCHASWGGAIATKKGDMGELRIGGGSFTECSSGSGGAIQVRGKGVMNVNTWDGEGCIFRENYAEDKSNKEDRFGGAICIEQNPTVNLFRAAFIGNHAGVGGAIYSMDKDGNYPDIFIDECSFDGNYISRKWGPAFATDGVHNFCMHNCSVRGSYTKAGEADWRKDLKPSWICIDDVTGVSTISNCTIIGNVQYSSDGENFTPLTDNTALIAVWGNQVNYITNCIVVPEDSGIDAFRGDTGSEKLDLYYTHYSSLAAATLANSGGNVSGRIKDNLDGLFWNDSWSSGEYVTRGFWQWDGKMAGTSPSMATQSNVVSRLTGICPDFVTWIDTDINNDQRRMDRGTGAWWPGAYQSQ